MIKVTIDFLKGLSKKAKESNRQRTIHCFHKESSDSLQRMINALELNTYVQPHKHDNPDKRELFIILTGSLVVIEFDDSGNIVEHTILDKNNGTLLVESAAKTWHTIIPLEKETTCYEIKDGPYNPDNDKKFAPWAPKEGDKEALNYNKKILEELGINNEL